MYPNFQRLFKQATKLTRSRGFKKASAAFQAALVKGMATPATTNGVGQSIRTPRQAPEIKIPVRPSSSVGRGQQQPREAGLFTKGSFASAADSRDYKLFIPPQAGSRPLPLVMMLHGCTQGPDDFAAGTAMNEAAVEHGFFVLYPAQSQQANPQRCWNWFKHSHQQRGRGEPALLAGMARQVMKEHGVDARRVYVGGLSAGGAMAAILGETYPELFAAVGVHSGLAAGIATDLPSALAAMQGSGGVARAQASAVPTIILHGDADTTVHPDNGGHVRTASAGADAAIETEQLRRGGRACTRTLHRMPDGKVVAEQWVIHGARHAWSGGRAQGSYTDAQGPDASAEMLRFFLEHPKPPSH